jgi:hypothetical protein
LTGIGPWTVWWNDGVVQTTNSTTGFGPLTLTRLVASQQDDLNTVTTNVFYISKLVDGRCTASMNDITGQVEILVTPCLTIWLTNQTNVVLSWIGNWWLLSTTNLTDLSSWGRPRLQTTGQALLRTHHGSSNSVRPKPSLKTACQASDNILGLVRSVVLWKGLKPEGHGVART